MIPADLLPVILPVVEILEDLEVPYQIGGSLASSAWGLPRSTQDIDLVADLQHSHVARFVSRLDDAYYIDSQAVQDAIQHRGSFNLIHLSTMFKIDIFIRKSGPFEDATFRRARRAQLSEATDQQATFTSPEDIVLHKLAWYRMGGGISERQWLDVLGVLKVQGADLDQTYLRSWSERLGLDDLLKRALEDAGL
jgi:hypothetical protein